MMERKGKLYAGSGRKNDGIGMRLVGIVTFQEEFFVQLYEYIFEGMPGIVSRRCLPIWSAIVDAFVTNLKHF